MYRFGRIIFANYRRFNNLRNQVEFTSRKFSIKPVKFVYGASSILSFFGTKKIAEDDEESELIMTMKRGVLASMRSEYDKAEQLFHLGKYVTY